MVIDINCKLHPLKVRLILGSVGVTKDISKKMLEYLITQTVN